ncbi:MAG: ABC transporter ATP-binding protein [Oscillospiraceae bacterium]|nr:ABC transporter ATP-binding protein [Oscillospiraceae bacterium]
MLEVRDLSVSYGKKEILTNVSFTLEKGTVTALLGANGCGKTTLIKALCGLLPCEGSRRLDGCDLRELSTKETAQQIGYIPQRSGISLSLTALDVVLMGFSPRLGLLQQPTGAMEAQARQTLAQLGLGADTAYLTLSEGQKQLCILARTLVMDAKVLLLDEPESALDLQNRYGLFEHLRGRLQDRAVLAVLHDPQLALQTADKLILLKDGTVHAVLHPKTDSPETMEQAFCGIYGRVRLHKIEDTIVMVR